MDCKVDFMSLVSIQRSSVQGQPPQPPTAQMGATSGNESDSSFQSSLAPPIPIVSPSTGAATGPSSTGPTTHALGTSILSSIREGDDFGVSPPGGRGLGAMSDPDIEEGEDEEGSEEEEEENAELRTEDGQQLKKGLEGERMLKSGYLLKKGEKRKVLAKSGECAVLFSSPRHVPNLPLIT